MKEVKMRTRSRQIWMLGTLLAAVLGITVSNLAGASGSVTGAGSSAASKIAFSAGACSAIAFLLLCMFALRARRAARRRAGGPGLRHG
jgi:protein-S-isoprenylcysteine O-methyltransferase Ste14